MHHDQNVCVCVYVEKEGNHENKRKGKKTQVTVKMVMDQKKNWITIHTHIIGPNENIYVYNNSNRFRIDGYYDDGERGP